MLSKNKLFRIVVTLLFTVIFYIVICILIDMFVNYKVEEFKKEYYNNTIIEVAYDR